MTVLMQHQFWAVCWVYHLTCNAKNMWWWEQHLGCFVCGRIKQGTSKHKGIQTYVCTSRLPLAKNALFHPQLSGDKHHDNVSYSGWSFTSKKAAVEKSGRSDRFLFKDCHLWAVIIIQHLNVPKMTTCKKNIRRWLKSQRSTKNLHALSFFQFFSLQEQTWAYFLLNLVNKPT